MPLSEVACHVPRLLELAHESGDGGVEKIGDAHFLVLRMCSQRTHDSSLCGELSRHKAGAAGRTDRTAHIELREHRPLAGQSIEIGSSDLGVPVDPEVAQCK